MALKDHSTLFPLEPKWTEHWQSMPEFNQRDLMPWQTIMVHFKNADDRRAFAQLVEQTITDNTKSLWYPKAEIVASFTHKSCALVNPKYPVYVISKGRWQQRLTVKALEKMRVDYRIVVEPQEYANYSAVIDERKILTLPFSNLGQGSIPARNWVLDHATAEKSIRHWILDDNISGFCRLWNNTKRPVASGSIFKAAEEFADRYENIALCGFNYRFFAKQKQNIPPFMLNTRIYSCILVRNEPQYRWRGRYNEDTDLSIRVLKDGHCTVLFNAFLADKQATMTMKGGNTDELYKDDGRLKMAESLRDQHPDIVTITKKFQRWQHHVDYSGFKKNTLILKPGVEIPEGIENYGMELEVTG